MAEYQIRELAHLTGVKAHTIRVWEQRYNLVEPKRTPTNIRYYDDDDLCVMLNVALLSENGYRISRIALMTPEQRAREVESLLARPLPDESHVIQQLVLATLRLDAPQFEQALSWNIETDGLEATMLRIIYPFMERVGILWQTGTINPAQEHLISNLVRQKVIAALDRLSHTRPVPGARTFVLYLPEQELHELSLLFMHYILRVRGQQVFYLGQNLPARDLAAVCGLVNPEYLLAACTVVPERADVEQYLASLAHHNPGVKLLLYGAQISADTTLPASARRFGSMSEFIKWTDEQFK
jgi:MerR family transcriptional regulator, light-induced transcriptional regulator